MNNEQCNLKVRFPTIGKLCKVLYMLTKISGPDLDPSILKNQGKFQAMEMDILTLSLPSSYYHTSPPSLSARNFPHPSPAITCILYIILPRERNFYP